MATQFWRGDAPAVAQQTAWVFGGAWEVGDLIDVVINGKTFTYAAASTTITTGILDPLAAALNALSPSVYPEWAEITWSRSGSSLVATADAAGKPFAVLLSTRDAGGAADAQTIDGATTNQAGATSTASAGPNDWSTASNHSQGSVPADTDSVYLANSDVDVLYGLDQSSIQPALLAIDQSYSGRVGLPRTSDAGYIEYREQYLKIGPATITIGQGEGAGSGRIKLDSGADQTTLNVYDSGSPEEAGLEAILWKGTHAANVVNIVKGSLGIAVLPGEAATIDVLRIGYRDNVAGDAIVRCGPGCTLDEIEKSGGDLEINSNCTVLTQTGGATTYADGAPQTLHVRGGTVYYDSADTLATANVEDGAVLDFSRDMRPKTVTNCNKYGDGRILDPHGVVTFTSGIICRGGIDGLDLGRNVTITPS